MTITTGDITMDRVRTVRTGLVAVAVVAPACVLVFGLAAGAPGAWGAVVGTAVTAGFFTVSALALAWADRAHPSLVLPVGLSTYVVKLLVLGVLLLGLQDSAAIQPAALAATVLATMAAWLIAQVRAVWTARLLYVDPSRAPQQRT